MSRKTKHHVKKNRLRFCMPLAGEFAYSRLITGSVIGNDAARKDHRVAGLLDLGIPRDRIHTTAGVYLPEAHNGMVKILLEHRDWDGVVWIEHDHQFDWNFVERLESYEPDKPVVGVRYYTRDLTDPRMMVANFINRDDPALSDPPYGIQYLKPTDVLKLLAAPGIYPMDFVPHGMTFVRREVYESIPAPWYQAGDKKELGDDVFFCALVRRHGFQVYVDTVPYAGHLTLGLVDDWWYMRELRRRFLELNFGRFVPGLLGGANVTPWLPEGLPEIIEGLQLKPGNLALGPDQTAEAASSESGT